MTYGKEHVLANYKPAEESETKADPADKVSRMLKSVHANLQPMIETHPDTKFIFYFPARSILYWIDAVRLGEFDAYMQEETELTEFLLQYDNAEVHFSQNDEELITDLERYTDTVHFDRDSARLVLERLHEGRFRADKENYQTIIEEFCNIVNNRASDPVFIKSLSQ